MTRGPGNLVWRCRPWLAGGLDEGSIGLPTVLYLFLKPVVRSTFHPDPAHRVMNNVTNSSNMSGLWIRILEVLVVLNLPTKPYNTDAQWHTMVGASNFLENCRARHRAFSRRCTLRSSQRKTTADCQRALRLKSTCVRRGRAWAKPVSFAQGDEGEVGQVDGVV